MDDLLRASWHRLAGLPGIAQDALVYLCAAGFAAAVGFLTVGNPDYQTWGKIALAPYAVAALVCAVGARGAHAMTPARVSWLRRAVFLSVLVGAVLTPLGAEMAWRAEAAPGAHAQAEVAVIERAGDRAVHGQDPYLRHPTSAGAAASSDLSAVDANTFFPYMPGMVSFGILNALPLPRVLRDARFAFALFTLLVGSIALYASGARLSECGRVLQFLVVLPSGALPMVTGGDDLPVVALMLLGLVLAQKRNPVGAGLALGFAASLKFTAWPLVLLLAFAARDREGRPALGRYSAAVGAVVGPAVAVGLALQPAAFVVNVVRFPLGLAKIKSPAASPLLGHFFVDALPAHKTVVTAALLVLGAAIAIAWLVRYPPRTPAAAARATAFVMVLATVLAPATRFGYLLYPANLLVWAGALPALEAVRTRAPATWRQRLRHGAAAGAAELRQLPTSLSTTLTSTVLPPAGAVEDASGSTNTPTSQ